MSGLGYFDDTWFISSWHSEFTFHTGQIKTRISPEQVTHIITEVGLCRVDSGAFSHGATYKSPHFIVSEIDRLTDLKVTMELELIEIRHAICSYENAVNLI